MGWKRRLANRVPFGLLALAHAAYWARHKTAYVRQQGVPPLGLTGAEHGRLDFYRHVADQFVREPVTFMEFGVFQGESLHAWTDLLQAPESRLYGFDTFEGLPESWKHWKAGHLSTDGALPAIADDRAVLWKGLFQETLDDALTSAPLDRQLILHIDSDLHSAALYVLSRMNDHLKSGDVIMFDQWGREHEYRAFQDFTTAYRRELKMLATPNDDYTKVAFHVLDG